MTYKENIKAILECYFIGFKEEIIDSACNRILDQEPCDDDAISRFEALEALNSINGTSELDKAFEVIEELPPVTPKPKWIPISERLPEKNMACLVAVGKFNLTQIAMYSDLMGTIDHRIFYQGDVGHDNFENITEYVKAWMPLPEPYKAESEEI